MTIRDLRDRLNKFQFNETRHWDLRGYDAAEVLATVATSIDEQHECLLDHAVRFVRGLGATEDEVEAVIDLQRKLLAKDREVYLAELRAWLERGCKSLN